MRWVLSIVLVVGGFIAINMLALWRRNRLRQKAGQLPEGERVLRTLDGVSTRLFVDHTLPKGPRAGGINRAPTLMVLSERRLLLASYQGRLLELGPGSPGGAKCTGPRRLVLEGPHPSGRTQVRAEMVVDDAEDWVAQINQLQSAGPS